MLLAFSVAQAGNGEVKWYGFNEGMALAKKEGKPVVIDFYADWCKWCKVMDKETFAEPEVAEILAKDYICIRVDTDSRQKLQYMGLEVLPAELFRMMEGSGLPATAFFDRDGRRIKTITGYITAPIFADLLKYIEKECYNVVSFTEFQQGSDRCSGD